MKSLIEEEVRTAYREMIMDGILAEEPYTISISTKGRLTNTACWTFKNDKHVIFVGANILDKLPKTDGDMSHYIQSYLYHEVAHSLYTERDLKAIFDALKSFNIPFRVHNLFEDLRIEHKMRTEIDRRFNWAEYEELTKSDIALSKLFILIQSEYGSLNEDEKNEILSRFDIEEKIANYYNDTTLCNDSWEVIEVIRNWSFDYPFPPEEDKEDDSDLMHSLLLQSDNVAFDEAMSDSENISEAPKGDNEKVESDLDSIEEFTTHDFSNLGYEETRLDSKTIQKMLPKIRTIFKSNSGYASTRKPSKKLNLKGVVQGSEYLYKKKLAITRAKKPFNFVIDCSGSMYGSPMSNAATIVAMFSELARENLVEGYVILSSSSGYQTFKMPMSRNKIEKCFQSGGAEGFDHTFSCVESILQKGEINFVITDGLITDGNLNKLEHTKKGIHTFGLYVGEPDKCNLTPWFHKGIARHKLSELVDELVRSILVTSL
jgi:hypothetical protein